MSCLLLSVTMTTQITILATYYKMFALIFLSIILMVAVKVVIINTNHELSSFHGQNYYFLSIIEFEHGGLLFEKKSLLLLSCSLFCR
jgi:hypothetical protein